MDTIEEQRLRNRLDDVIADYQDLVKNFENIQWKIVRKQKEIKTICDKLGLEIKPNEKEQ